MNVVLAVAGHLSGPHIDWAQISPILALVGGGLLVLMVGLLPARVVRHHVVPALTLVAFGATIGLAIWRLHHQSSVIAGALRMDDLAYELDMLFAGAGIAATLLSWRVLAPREAGHGEYHALMLFSAMGMAILVSATNVITLFIGLELLSIPLYILCASETRREGSLESGLKYLIIGSVGSATLVYGLALIYGATGSTDFGGIAHALAAGHLHGHTLGYPMVLTGIGLAVVGFAFKASVAPLHQWTPDVYQGAPTPITAFMATATKAAALGVIIRFFDVAVFGARGTWAPMLAALATITIVVGNVGALGQASLKRMMGYSGVAQAGYMLGGVVVGTHLGIQATVLYLFAYLGMNMAVFPVIVASELQRPDGDEVPALAGLGARNPWLAWPMTIGMLALAGIPGTVGFIGKFQLIHALVAGNYTWLAIVLVIGSMISLGYYLRVVASIWMRGPSVALTTGAPATVGAYAPIAGGSQEADGPGDGQGETGGSDAAEGPGEPAGRSPERPGASEEAGGLPGERGGGHADELEPGELPGALTEQGVSAGGEGGATDGGGDGQGSAGAPGSPETPSAPPEPGPGGSVPGEGSAAYAPGAGSRGHLEVTLVGVVFAAATVVFGIVPGPLFSFAAHAGRTIAGLL
jgi:NADH-quinone oxidoreductase subunit N